ncbi:MAG: type II toxin-antitoxin system MqsA family antitoxin [Nitrospira sp.]|nr:type II toxin-antitoxin system MqsA family antitoxin [Nitrospira sp.]
MLQISKCPSCGSNKIKKVRRKWTGKYQGQLYSVPRLEFHECPACGEKVYDCEAMRKIEAHSPAFVKARAS